MDNIDTNNRHYYSGLKQFNIIHWNSRSLLPKIDQLKNFISKLDESVDMLLFNETWLNSSKNLKLPGFIVIRRDSNRPHGGVAIAIRSKYKYKLINTPSQYHFQNILITVYIDSTSFDILCVYAPPPPNGKFTIKLLKDSCSKLVSNNYIIIGDFNAHHVSWGSRVNERRGNALHAHVECSDLVCLNDHINTTFAPFGQQGNVLDLVFATQVLSSSCTVSVLDDLLSSNHFPLLISMYINSVPVFYPDSSNLLEARNVSQGSDSLANVNFKRIDWTVFNNLCETEFSTFQYVTNNPLENYETLFKILHDILMTFAKKCYQRKSNRHKAVPWWSTDCDRVVTQAKIALLSYKQYPTMENYIIYKKLDAIKKRTLLEAKRLSWSNLCLSFNRMTSSKIIWDHIRRFKHAKLDSFSSSPYFFQNPTNVVLFLDKVASSSSSEHSNLQKYFNKPGTQKARWILDTFSFSEFLAALENKKETSPGPDFISYKVIKSLPTCAKEILCKIFNDLWQKNIIPPSWKMQHVVPILKPYKEPNSVDSYRPISLTSCFSKIFESMIKNRLEWFTESNKIIPNTQYGFRKGKSTIDNLACLIGDIRNNFHNNQYTLAVFLDIKGAFDNIDHNYLIKSLDSLGFPGHILSWLFNFLNTRYLTLKIKSTLTGNKISTKGTPQGSVLSPLVFILSLINFMNQIPSTVKHLFFADDLVLYVNCNDITTGESVMNDCLSNIYELLTYSLKLEVNVPKCSVILFSQNGLHYPQVLYDSQPIPVQSFVKYVGLYLDFDLSWKSHINAICKRAELGLNILKSLAGLKWGADPKVLKTLYISTIRSHFDYGCMFFADANVSLLRKLDIIQNRALRIITGAMMSSPINSLEVEAGIVPLFIRRSYLTDKYCLKLISCDNQITSRYLENYNIPNYNLVPLSNSASISENMTYLNFEFQDTVHWSILLPCFEYNYYNIITDVAVDIIKFESKYEFLDFLIDNNSYIQLYTDGSKMQHRTSFAFYDSFLNTGKSYECNNNFSVFSTELLGLIYALEHINDNYCAKNKFLILSDSMSALQAIKNNNIRASVNYLILKLKSYVSSLCKRNIIVRFCWVPGHSGIIGNETVDKLTKSTVNIQTCNLKVPHSDLVPFVKQNMIRRWSNYLLVSRETKGKWLAEIVPQPSIKSWFETNKMFFERPFTSTICRLRIGHARFPAHLFRLKLSESASCVYCYHNNCDLEHIFFQCPQFNLQRLRFIALCTDTGIETIPDTVQKLLKLPQLYPIIYNFVLNTIGGL